MTDSITSEREEDSKPVNTACTLDSIDKSKLTPMMKQYSDIKSEVKDNILFYRLGDFYEMFFDDAITASSELDLTLTGKSCGLEERAPMCGVPYHSCEGYIARLVAKGYNVSICEQAEDPKLAKGLVKREIVRTITPGTITDTSMLEESRNNYICAVLLDENAFGICFADISTGEVNVTEICGGDILDRLFVELGRFSPAEIISNDRFIDNNAIKSFLDNHFGITANRIPASCFDKNEILEKASGYFGEEKAKLLSNPSLERVAKCMGALIIYLSHTRRDGIFNLCALNVYSGKQYMELDLTAVRNLELCETLHSREKRGSLLWVLDKTKTSMGGRLMRQWIEKPLVDETQIRRRQQACSELMSRMIDRDDIIELLKGIVDIDRLSGKVAYGSANARDLKSIGETLARFPQIKDKLAVFSSPMLEEINSALNNMNDLSDLLKRAIVDEPPFTVREGGIIRAGYNAQVDELNSLMTDSQEIIAKIEERERAATGIKTLRIGYNRVFGYYIEVSKGAVNQVPASYIRKQTLSTGERYINQELKDLEARILTAKDRVVALEYSLFCELRNKVLEQAASLQSAGRALAELDVLCSLADVGQKNNYVMPEINQSGEIRIEAGRHPVAEKLIRDSVFVPNDTLLDLDKNRMAIITGPNMAGKSTYMRQNALIVIMAQMGAPVPARSASVGICDRIFTRIGASDDLTTGQSTFMVEMNEVAHILKHATKDSLLILDEIGRGTSTFDGMAIARAVLEFAADAKILGAKTLFATHYHELTALENSIDGVKNYNIAVKKRGDDITFLRKIVAGAADDSYGIEVAGLAGLPGDVISRAKEILSELESGRPEQQAAPSAQKDVQISLDTYTSPEMDFIRSFAKINTDILTPIEAMNELYKFKKQAAEFVS